MTMCCGPRSGAESLRDLVSTILETNLTIQGNRLNTVMKKVTSWAAIIAVPTAVTGYYGMNVPIGVRPALRRGDLDPAAGGAFRWPVPALQTPRLALSLDYPDDQHRVVRPRARARARAGSDGARRCITRAVCKQMCCGFLRAILGDGLAGRPPVGA